MNLLKTEEQELVVLCLIDGNTSLNCTSPEDLLTKHHLLGRKKHAVASSVSEYLLSLCNASITKMCNQEFFCTSSYIDIKHV